MEESHWRHLALDNGEKKLLIKLNIRGNDSYEILVCDLANMWREVLEHDSIKKRCETLNRRLEAPAANIIEHLSKTINNNHITQDFFLKVSSHACMVLSVKNTFKDGIPFVWDFSCEVVDNKECLGYFVSPLLKLTASLQCANLQLEKVIKQKDAEIQDYKDSGAAVTRPYLETEEFDAGKFHKAFREDYSYCKAICRDPFMMASDSSLNHLLVQIETDSKMPDVISKAAGEPPSPKSALGSKIGSKGMGKTRKRARRPPRGIEVISDSDGEADDHAIGATSPAAKVPVLPVEQKIKRKKTNLQKKKKKLF